MLLSTISFPFNFSILLTGFFFFIALIASNDNSRRFVVFSAITINQVHVEELKISLEHQKKKRVFTLLMFAAGYWRKGYWRKSMWKFQGSVNEEVEFSWVLKKNSRGIPMGLGFWRYNVQGVSHNFAEKFQWWKIVAPEFTQFMLMDIYNEANWMSFNLDSCFPGIFPKTK